MHSEHWSSICPDWLLNHQQQQEQQGRSISAVAAWQVLDGQVKSA
jgi:hypothetical protein